MGRKFIAKTAEKKVIGEASVETVTKKNGIIIPAVFLFFLAVILYANSLSNGYALDDTLMITKNEFTQMGVKGIGKIMSTDAFVGFFGEEKNLLPGGRYRPLSHVLFAVEYELFGANPFWGHLMNVLWYGLLVVLIYFALKIWLPENSEKQWYWAMPFLVALIYALHPLHTEVVANIKGRDEIMSMSGCMLLLIFLKKRLERKGIIWDVGIFLAFLFAVLSKENALTFVAVVPLVLWFFSDIKLKKVLVVMLPVLLALISYFAIRFYALGFIFGTGVKSAELLNEPFLEASVSEKYATIFYTLGLYLKLLFVPHPLTHDYYPKHIPIINWADMRAIISFMAYAALGLLALWGLKRKRIWSFAILFFVITLSISSNLVISIGAFMNERFLFMPSLALALVLAWLIHAKFSGRHATLVKGVFAVYMLLFAVKTVSRTPVWKDDFTLFTTDVLVSDNSAKVNVSAGGALIDRALQAYTPSDPRRNEMLSKAVFYLNRGVSIHPKYVAAWLLKGNAHYHLGDLEMAFESYENSLKLAPKYDLALKNILALTERARIDNKMELSEKAINYLLETYPDSATYHYHKALNFEKSGKLSEALQYLEQAIALNASDSRFYSKSGELYGRHFNNIPKAIEMLAKAIVVNPKDFTALENLGVAYGIMGQFSNSIRMFEQALPLKPDQSTLLQNMILTYRNMGAHQKADSIQAILSK